MAEKAASKKTAKKRTATIKTATVKRVRKAPTKTPVQEAASEVQEGVPGYLKFAGALALALFVVLGVSVFIGLKDSGVIDVRGIINDKADSEAAQGNEAESQALRNMANQNTNKPVANGGLRGAGNKTTRQQEIEKEQANLQAQENASSTATSTAETASSTEDVVIEDEGDNNTEEETTGNVEVEERALEESTPTEEETTTEETPTEESTEQVAE